MESISCAFHREEELNTGVVCSSAVINDKKAPQWAVVPSSVSTAGKNSNSLLFLLIFPPIFIIFPSAFSIFLNCSHLSPLLTCWSPLSSPPGHHLFHPISLSFSFLTHRTPWLSHFTPLPPINPGLLCRIASHSRLQTESQGFCHYLPLK